MTIIMKTLFNCVAYMSQGEEFPRSNKMLFDFIISREKGFLLFGLCSPSACFLPCCPSWARGGPAGLRVEGGDSGFAALRAKVRWEQMPKLPGACPHLESGGMDTRHPRWWQRLS